MTEPMRRWHLKKAARKSAVMASTLSGSLEIRRLVGRPKVRVLTYHRFGHAERDPWCVTPQAFEKQMSWLAERRLAVSLEDVLRFVRGEVELADGSVLVTIDDGFSSVLSLATPILLRYSIPAVAYVTTSAIGNKAAGEGAGEPFMTWDQLSKLCASAVTLGSHGHTHRSMANLHLEEARAESLRSKQLIEQRLGIAVNSFAYAYGMRGDENADTARILSECGYESVFISQHGTIQAGGNPLRLPRIKVEAGESMWMFKLICRGGMDIWSMADKIL